jgi:phage-related tail protein
MRTQSKKLNKHLKGLKSVSKAYRKSVVRSLKTKTAEAAALARLAAEREMQLAAQRAEMLQQGRLYSYAAQVMNASPVSAGGLRFLERYPGPATEAGAGGLYGVRGLGSYARSVAVRRDAARDTVNVSGTEEDMDEGDPT